MALFGKLPGKKLREAACEGHLDEVHRIISKGVDVNDRSASTGATALYEAVVNGHVHILSALLESGADANIADHWGEIPLLLAAKKGLAKIVHTLINHPDFKRLTKQKVYAAFYSACKGGHTDTALQFIPLGADVNYVDPQDEAGSALHAAAALGHFTTVRALIENGAKVNLRKIKTSWNMDGTVKIVQGGTPLHEAVRNGHTDVAKLLLHKGGDVTIADMLGGSAAHRLYVTALQEGKTPPMVVCANYKGSDTAKVATDIRSLLSLGGTMNNKLFGQMVWASKQQQPSLVSKELEVFADDVIRALDKNNHSNSNTGKDNNAKPVSDSAPRKQEDSAPAALPKFLIPRSKMTLPKAKLNQLCMAGGYGEVVEGEMDKVKVAVKLFNYRLLGFIDEKEAVKEALQLQAANNPYVCKCLGILEDSATDVDGSLQGSLVMEWAAGGSMYLWLQGEGASTGFKGRIALAAQLAEGMKHLHELNIVHGDLRPHNVVVDADKEEGAKVRLTGYGLSFHNSSSMMSPRQAQQPGCLEHRSPERLSETFQGSTQDDVYAFGVLMHFIATGLPAFPRIRADELERAICRGHRPPLKDWALAQPEGIQQQVATAYLRLAESCWQHNWWSRPSAAMLLDRLRGMLVLSK